MTDRIGPAPGEPEVRPGWFNEDEAVDWRRSTERDTADYQRERRTRDAAQWNWDHRLPEDHSNDR